MKFRKSFSDRKAGSIGTITSPLQCKVELLGSIRAKIARLFIAGNYSRNFEDARILLKKLSEIDFSADYLLTPSAFIEIPWRFSSLDEAARAAMQWAEKLLDGVEINADHILLGIDSYSGAISKPHVELSINCLKELRLMLTISSSESTLATKLYQNLTLNFP